MYEKYLEEYKKLISIRQILADEKITLELRLSEDNSIPQLKLSLIDTRPSITSETLQTSAGISDQVIEDIFFHFLKQGFEGKIKGDFLGTIKDSTTLHQLTLGVLEEYDRYSKMVQKIIEAHNQTIERPKVKDIIC